MREHIVMDGIAPLPAFDSDWEKEVPYKFGDLAIVIEYLAGDTRTKVSGSGFVMKGVMPAAYGRIVGTTDVHGEEIDMYLAPMATTNSDIFVVDQVNPDTGMFDEHKVMLGFGSLDEALVLYTSVFADGSGEKRMGAITRFPVSDFLVWLDQDGSNLRPAKDFQDGKTKTVMGAGVKTPPRFEAEAPRDSAGGVILSLPNLSAGPQLTTKSSKDGCFDYHLHLYSAFGIETWSNAVDTFCRVCDLAGPQDTIHIHIACQGGSVFMMGRMKSSMARTKAKVITYAEGCVASAATTVWAAGHERHIAFGSYFMQHMSGQMLAGRSTSIAAKALFCARYIDKQLEELADIGLFTQDEIKAMSESSQDVYISGRTAIERMGAVSTRA